MKRLNLAVLIATITLLGCGCNGMQTRLLKGPDDWSQGGASVVLPEGTWRAEWEDGDETDHCYTVFSEINGPGRIVFWRIFTPGNVPGWLSLQDLFLEFRKKNELGRWTLKTQAGKDVDCVAFVLLLDERRVFATGCAVEHGLTTYAVIAWGFEKGHSASRRVAEAVIESLKLEIDN